MLQLSKTQEKVVNRAKSLGYEFERENSRDGCLIFHGAPREFVSWEEVRLHLSFIQKRKSK